MRVHAVKIGWKEEIKKVRPDSAEILPSRVKLAKPVRRSISKINSFTRELLHY